MATAEVEEMRKAARRLFWQAKQIEQSAPQPNPDQRIDDWRAGYGEGHERGWERGVDDGVVTGTTVGKSLAVDWLEDLATRPYDEMTFENPDVTRERWSDIQDILCATVLTMKDEFWPGWDELPQRVGD
jgi:hypothetical protein